MESSLERQTEFAPPSIVARLKARSKARFDAFSAAPLLSAAFSARTRGGLVLLAVGVLLYRVSCFEREYLYSLLVDDGYISARHALNLVEGHGLNFNVDERVEGYTNFVYTLLMAVPHVFEWPLEPFIRGLGCVTALCVVAATWHIARDIVGPLIAAMIGAAMLLDQRFVFFSIWGLETTFAGLPCLVGYICVFRGRLLVAGLAFAAGAMTRIDMAVIIAPAFLYVLVRPDASLAAPSSNGRSVVLQRLAARMPQLLSLGVPFGAAFGTYFCARWYYYGWLLPNTFYAKVGQTGDSWRRGWAYLVECIRSMGLTWLIPVAVGAWVACFALLAARRAYRDVAWPDGFSRGTVFLVACLGYLAYVVRVGGDHFAERFIYHIFPILLIACVAPLRWVCVLLMPSRERGERWAWLPPVAFSLALIGGLATSPHRFGRSGSLAGWVSLGKYLKDVARPGALLATDAAGALPYYSGLKTIDVLGLADIHIGHMPVPKLGSGPAGHEKRDLAYVLDRKPDYISTWLDADGVAGRGFGRMPGFDRQYRLAALVRTDSSEVTRERVRTFDDEGPSRAELVKLRAGTAPIPGRFNWALYERRPPGSFAPLPTAGFRSNLPGWRPSNDYIVAAKKGHAPAHIMWGPFVRLPAGPVKGYVELRLENLAGVPAGQRLCGFDVFDGKKSLTQTSLVSEASPADAVRKLPFSFVVSPEQVDSKLEFRMYCWGGADVTVESVYLSTPSNAS